MLPDIAIDTIQKAPKTPVSMKEFRNSSEKFLYVATSFMFCKVTSVKVN